MPANIPPLDKSLETPTQDGYGTITIRIVVLDKNMASSASVAVDDSPADAAPDELLPERDKKPTSSFLEEPKRGTGVCVFLINGQRQHTWDNQFIVRDLGLKYLRNRMIVVVDCDGLKPEAIADLMQGSRHQFYDGKVYSALEARVIATLKADPDLRKLEEEAEDDIASLQAGDEAVKSALDQLIEAHHEAAVHTDHGHVQPGDSARDEKSTGTLKQTSDVVVETTSQVGSPANEPVLSMRPDVSAIRLKPNEERRFSVIAKPEHEWKQLETLALTFDPPLKELQAARTTQISSEEVLLKFVEPEDIDPDEYPIDTTLRIVAMFKGQEEPRMLERRVVITRRSTLEATPPIKQVLTDDPTYVRVTSRPPIKLLVGGPDVHVRLRWDGNDALITGPSPEWAMRVTCEAPAVEPVFFVTKPLDGRFELLIQASPGLHAGEQLKFDVEAVGSGKTLSTAFLVDVVAPPSPRKITSKVAGGGQRRPPYELKYLRRANWTDGNMTCFGDAWSGAEPGAFDEPTAKSPLTIFINQDTDMLVAYRDQLLAKKLAETTIQQRVNKYTAHVAFHLYQMYERQRPGADNKDAADPPTEAMMREEIQRVARTLIKLMEVAQ